MELGAHKSAAYSTSRVSSTMPTAPDRVSFCRTTLARNRVRKRSHRYPSAAMRFDGSASSSSRTLQANWAVRQR